MNPYKRSLTIAEGLKKSATGVSVIHPAMLMGGFTITAGKLVAPKDKFDSARSVSSNKRRSGQLMFARQMAGRDS